MYWSSLGKASSSSVGVIEDFVGDMASHRERVDSLEKEAAQIVLLSPGANDETERLAKKSLIINSIFVSYAERAMARFEEKRLKEPRDSCYARNYFLLKSLAGFAGLSVDQMVFRWIPQQSPFRYNLKLAVRNAPYPQNVVDALREVDVQSIPNPDEYAKPFEPFLFHSIVDECKSEFASRAIQVQVSKPKEKKKLVEVPSQSEVGRKKKKKKRGSCAQAQRKDFRAVLSPLVTARGYEERSGSQVNPVSATPKRHYSRSYGLPDDGSRVTEVLEESVTVTQTDGTELIVYPFPSFV
jgi:hypothetical protein